MCESAASSRPLQVDKRTATLPKESSLYLRSAAKKIQLYLYIEKEVYKKTEGGGQLSGSGHETPPTQTHSHSHLSITFWTSLPVGGAATPADRKWRRRGQILREEVEPAGGEANGSSRLHSDWSSGRCRVVRFRPQLLPKRIVGRKRRTESSCCSSYSSCPPPRRRSFLSRSLLLLLSEIQDVLLHFLLLLLLSDSLSVSAAPPASPPLGPPLSVRR